MDFGVRVLRGGENPWGAPEQVGLYYRELVSLLSLDVVDIDIEAAIVAGFHGSASVDADDAAALEKLLGNPELEARISKGIEAIMGALGGRALALSVPGPGRLARQFLTDEVDEDALDDLALAITALVRAVFRPGITFLRVTEEDPRALEFLSPLTNMAAHYECASLLVLLGDAAASDQPVAFDVVYREASGGQGSVLPEAWWSDDGLAPIAASLYAKIPPAGRPEDILARLSDLARKMA
jgi:hypothetical protein